MCCPHPSRLRGGKNEKKKRKGERGERERWKEGRREKVPGPFGEKKALHKKDTCIGLVSGLNDSHWLTQEFVRGWKREGNPLLPPPPPMPPTDGSEQRHRYDRCPYNEGEKPKKPKERLGTALHDRVEWRLAQILHDAKKIERHFSRSFHYALPRGHIATHGRMCVTQADRRADNTRCSLDLAKVYCTFFSFF